MTADAVLPSGGLPPTGSRSVTARKARQPSLPKPSTSALPRTLTGSRSASRGHRLRSLTGWASAMTPLSWSAPAATCWTAGPSRWLSPTSLLEEQGHTLEMFIEDVTARMPTPQEARLLNLSPGVPVFRLVRTAHDMDGRAVEVCDTVMAAEAYQLSYELP